MANTKIDEQRQALIEDLLTNVETKEQGHWENPLFSLASKFDNYNPTSGKSYKGMNQIRLAVSADMLKTEDPRWLTYKQASELGLQVKKGSKGTHIEYWEKVQVKKDKLDENGKPVLGKNGKPIKEVVIDPATKRPQERIVGKSYVVFNGSQIEGIPAYEYKQMPSKQRSEELETILEHSQAPISYDAIKTNGYWPKDDTIHLVNEDRFKSRDALISIALHEIGHSTGHESRLNRSISSFDKNPENYAREELVAELTSAMLQAKYNLPVYEETKENAENYMKSWYQLVKDNPNELSKAAQQAEKATTYIENTMLRPYLKDKTYTQQIEETRLAEAKDYTKENIKREPLTEELQKAANNIEKEPLPTMEEPEQTADSNTVIIDDAFFTTLEKEQAAKKAAAKTPRKARTTKAKPALSIKKQESKSNSKELSK